MYKRILLAADGSENSIRAAVEAAKIASLSGDSVVEILYVMDFSRATSEVLRSQNSETLEFERRKKLLPIEETFKQANVTSKITMLHGEPGPTIVDYANKQSCDLIIIGSRGLNKFQEMVLGSVSHKVAKRVNCPVLIVK
ncbi:universal stress protein [Lederbergia citrea]|uniref:Universal stress protein n=1 Tax=Lederbergia citrea TaxID=2833581 RepID=A0A942UJU3_9BACI|nr:universal stress protein [Lederbergia citrea]MBS4175986.1 universal stress protein [Lederbergia citrea]MBS4202547.1 universal stress protein [Lederbergia citrea]MBS4222786.1 universal stress protein [Lederbergia citrea]